jgi:hypothetical protein
MTMKTMVVASWIVIAILTGVAHGELRVPAFTAYLDPDPEGADISKSGVTGWNDPAIKALWFGQFKNTGRLECAVALKLRSKSASRFRLTVADESREVAAEGDVNQSITVHFKDIEIRKPGYQRFVLESLNKKGEPVSDVEALVLDGPASRDAHFNLKPHRNAASVHLFYPQPKDEKIEAFYCEVTGLEDPPATYYMACGWHRGYFGMQVIDKQERRIIFSVWDSGDEAVDRSKVAAADRVTLVAKGENVHAGDFGNEGTGGHSHLKYMWKTGEKQKFLVTATPVDDTHTVYAGYYFRPDKKEWMLISSWKAPKEGGYLRGLYSFSENFGGSTGHIVRKATFGNQWVRTTAGRWIELTAVTFSHDGTGKADRLDRFMGVEKGQFFLSHGGFIEGFTRYGEKFERPATDKPPTPIRLPSTSASKPS